MSDRVTVGREHQWRGRKRHGQDVATGALSALPGRFCAPRRGARWDRALASRAPSTGQRQKLGNL